MRLKINKIRDSVISKLCVFSCLVCFLIFSSRVYGFKVTVNSTIPTGSGNYQTFDELLTVIEDGTLSMSGNVDSVIFTDTGSITFGITKNLSNGGVFKGSIVFTSINRHPNKFPVLNHTTGDWYNFFERVNVTFERVVFRGSINFRSGQAANSRKFRNCVIRDFKASSFFQIEGNLASTTIFENCLFVNDTFTNAAINIATWSGTAPIIKIINCTFYNVNNVFKTGGSTAYMSGSTSIFNCIFNKCSNVCSDTLLLRKTTYSLTNEAITKYGSGCISDTNARFIVESGKYLPEDWRPTMASPARHLGIESGAPTVDISDTIRVDTVGRRDAGCWDIRDTITPPLITKQPKDTVVAVGSTVVFRVVATGTKPLSYKWINVETAEIVSTTDSFKIASATDAMDSSLYYCVVSNIRDSVVSNIVTLRVVQKPKITKSPESLVLFEGDTAFFNITVSGAGLTYVWKRDGTVIANANGSTYTIPNVKKSDSGSVFVCIVSNIAGADSSTPALLRVISPAAKILSYTKDTTLYEGSSLTLNVKAEGRAPLSYKWTKMMDTTTLSKVDSLKLNNISVEDSGRYLCVVSNNEGKDSVVIKLNVLSGRIPQITAQSIPYLFVKEGEKLTLFVTATGTEPLSYTWYKKKLPSGADSIGGNTQYVVASFTKADTGIYFCVVKNRFGIDTTSDIKVSLKTSNPYNPLILSTYFVDPLKIGLIIENFRNLPASIDTPPYVDTIGIWYSFLTYPEKLSNRDSNLIKISLKQMLNTGKDKYDTIISIITQVPDECKTIFLTTSPIWRKPDTIMPSTEFSIANLFLCGRDTLENNLVFNVVHNRVSDSITVNISNINSIRDSLMYLLVRYAFSKEDFSTGVMDKIPEKSLPSGDVLTKTYKDERFAGPEDSVTVWVYWRGKAGNYSRTNNKKVVIVGKPRPENTAKIYVDSVKYSSAFIHWSFQKVISFDSIRIWWGEKLLPLIVEPDPILFKSITLDKDRNSVIIEDLNPSTHYYVGLQIKAGDLWSSITENSRDTFTTKAGIGNIPNTIKLLSVNFDSKTNLFTLQWSIDTTGIGSVTNLETGIVWASNNPPPVTKVPTSLDGKIVSDLKKDSNIVTIDLGDKLLFSTRYYFALLLRVKGDTIWTPSTDSSRGFIDVPEPTWQVVVYFRDNDSVVTAFNNEVKIWKEGKSNVSVTDTLKIFKPVATEGFVVVSHFGIDFVKDLRSDPVNVGLKYDTTLLKAFKPEDIRIYQYSADSGWRVIEEYKLDKNNRMVSFLKKSTYVDPIILMIDTVPPKVKILSDTSRYALGSVELSDTFIVSDNISNSEIKFTYWNLNLNSDTGFVEKCKGKEYNFISVIPSIYIVNDRSVYANLSISDGRNRKEINLSRSTYVARSEALYLDSNRWTPISTSVLLNDSSLEGALKELSSFEKWKYDSAYFRIFRWLEDSSLFSVAKKNSKNYEDRWVEYHQSVKNFFSIVPGRVIWVKSRSNKVISNMGSGITVDLKQPYSIVVKAKSWTDISLPYKFEIKIGDIMEATSVSFVKDSLLIYLWEEDIVQGRLHTSPKYIPLMPGKDSLEFTLTYKYGEDGVGTYSVYNNSSSDIILKIPAIPEAMSKYNPSSSGGVSKRVEEKLKGWSVVVESKTEKGKLSPVYCGYTPGKGISSFPPSPSFGKQRVLVVDVESNSVNGNLIYHEIKESENGFVFPLLFNNGDKNISEFTYSIAAVTDFPENYLITIYNPQDKQCESELKERKVVVSSESKEFRYLLVGDSSFIALWSERLTGKIAFYKIYPNPFRREIQIRFYLPYGDKYQGKVRLYDQLGRMVCNEIIESNKLHSGINVLQLNLSSIKKLGSAAYLLEILILNSEGKVAAKKAERVLYLP